MRCMTYSDLVDRYQTAVDARQTAERLLLQSIAGTAEGRMRYSELRRIEAIERTAWRDLNAHPDRPARG